METLLARLQWEPGLNWSNDQTLPKFVENFHSSVASLLPSVWLWATAPLYLTYLMISSSPPLPGPGRDIIKQRLATVQIFLCVLRLSLREVWWKPWGLQLSGQGFDCLSLGLVIAYTSLERKRGFVTSGVLFVYWLLVTFSHCVLMYINFIKVETWSLQFVIDSACFILCTIQLVLSCFAESLPTEPGKKPCPIGRCSFLSRITFNWVHELVKIGYSRPLTEDDLFMLDESEKSRNVVPKFEEKWKAEVKSSQMSQNKKYKKRDTWRKLISSIWSNSSDTKSSSSDTDNSTDSSSSPKTKVSLLKVLARTFGLEFLLGLVWTLSHASQNFLNPIFLKYLIEFVEDPSAPNWKGYCLAGLILVTKSVSAFSHRQVHSTYNLKLGSRIKAALTSAIYKKSLSMSNRARTESTVGEIVNLMSVDAEQLRELCEYLWNVLACVMTFIFCLLGLYFTLGVAMFPGMAVFLIVIPLNGYLMKLIEKADDNRMDEKDKRIKLMNEILNGIKVLKLYAWELAFGKKIQAIREEELRYLNRERTIDRVLALSWIMIPFEVGIATFGTYVYLSEDNRIDAQTVFVTLSLFDIIRDWTSWLPWLVMDLIRSTTSLKRINKFLNHEDLDESNVSHDSSDDAVTIDDGTFTWDVEMGPCLKGINVTVRKGSLVAVVGSVGAGKSSLISAMLGEMEKTRGTVNVDGSTAYVSQQAWIQNATLKNNILFGKPAVDTKYDGIIDACALQPDLDILPAKDLTEIGEKGVNLSGGQKQRVSLARAVYFDADIYLLDDPLSAVDSHVGKHIFQQVIGSKGLLKDKTRILVTHGIKWLPYVDKIIVMRDGSVAEVGTYEQLMEHDGAFAKFLKTYLTEHNSDSDSDEEVKELKSATIQRLASFESTHGVEKTRPKQKNPKFCRSTSENMHEYRPASKRLTTVAIDDTHLGLDMFNIHGKDGDTHLRRRIVSASENQSTTEDIYRRSVSATSPHCSENNVRQNDTEIKKDSKANITEEEEVETGSVRLQVYLSYLKALGYKSFLLMVCLFGLFEASTVGSSYWLARWTADERLHNLTVLAADSKERMYLNIYYIGMYGGLAVIQGFFLMCYATVHKHCWIKAASSIHKDFLVKILRAPMSFFDTTPTGRIVNRFSKDIENIDHGLPERLGEMTDACCTVLSVSFVIIHTTPLLTIVILLLIVLFCAQAHYYRPTSRQLQRIESKSRSPVYNHFNETLNGVSVIRAFNVQKRFEEESEKRVDHNQQCRFYCNVSNNWFDVRLELAGCFVVWMATVFTVMGRDRLTGSDVGLMISHAFEICFCLEWVINNVTHLENNVVSMERIEQYSNNPTEAPLHTDQTPDSGWPHSGNVDLSNYSVRYRDGLDCVLKDINVSIQPGKKVGIVGRTGAGKSSLTLSIFRLLEPAAGKITIDGEDITQLGLYDLRSRLTILPQDPVLFAGSLRMNLDPLDKHTDEDIWQALKHAHLKSFVETLPEKLKYECGEGGQNLSVGQRQLICLARSLLRKTKILVLDEATAAVDMATDELIQKTINTEFNDCTVMTIAHRLNTVLDYDKILVLDKGEIKEYDSPMILLRDKKSMFYSMAKDAGLV